MKHNNRIKVLEEKKEKTKQKQFFAQRLNKQTFWISSELRPLRKPTYKRWKFVAYSPRLTGVLKQSAPETSNTDSMSFQGIVC